VYARSTTISSSPAAIDQGISYLRDTVMPAILDMTGCIGMSLLVDRESGRCIATSSWETEQDMRATADRMNQVRTKGTEAFGGTIDNIQEWEIALLHREHDTKAGTRVRVSWLKGDPAQVQKAIDTFRTSVLPAVEQLKGFCSASLLVDRATGRSVSTFAYDTTKALEASRERAMAIRSATSQQLSAQVEDVHEFELAIAHLRVPELV
jgi:heme-degrading monooxygenase HmoA